MDDPPGVCVTAKVFDCTSASGSRFPDLDGEVTAAYRALGDRCGTPSPAVAIRSSAPDEDGCDASFAGQHETYLR